MIPKKLNLKSSKGPYRIRLVPRCKVEDQHDAHVCKEERLILVANDITDRDELVKAILHEAVHGISHEVALYQNPHISQDVFELIDEIYAENIAQAFGDNFDIYPKGHVKKLLRTIEKLRSGELD